MLFLWQIGSCQLGGIGSGSIGRGFKGEFGRFFLKPGFPELHIVSINAFSVSVHPSPEGCSLLCFASPCCSLSFLSVTLFCLFFFFLKFIYLFSIHWFCPVFPCFILSPLIVFLCFFAFICFFLPFMPFPSICLACPLLFTAIWFLANVANSGETQSTDQQGSNEGESSNVQEKAERSWRDSTPDMHAHTHPYSHVRYYQIDHSSSAVTVILTGVSKDRSNVKDTKSGAPKGSASTVLSAAHPKSKHVAHKWNWNLGSFILLVL